MTPDRLNELAHRLLKLPELLGQAQTAFLKRRLDRNDWIGADEPDIARLVARLLEDHPQ